MKITGHELFLLCEWIGSLRNPKRPVDRKFIDAMAELAGRFAAGSRDDHGFETRVTLAEPHRADCFCFAMLLALEAEKFGRSRFDLLNASSERTRTLASVLLRIALNDIKPEPSPARRKAWRVLWLDERTGAVWTEVDRPRPMAPIDPPPLPHPQTEPKMISDGAIKPGPITPVPADREGLKYTENNLGRVNEVVASVRIPGCRIRTIAEGRSVSIQIRSDRPDATATHVQSAESLPEQSGRKWTISPHATASEIVQTCFLAGLQFMEHEYRETFRFRDQPIFRPHHPVEDLVDFTRDHAPEVRPTPVA